MHWHRELKFTAKCSGDQQKGLASVSLVVWPFDASQLFPTVCSIYTVMHRCIDGTLWVTTKAFVSYTNQLEANHKFRIEEVRYYVYFYIPNRQNAFLLRGAVKPSWYYKSSDFPRDERSESFRWLRIAILRMHCWRTDCMVPILLGMHRYMHSMHRMHLSFATQNNEDNTQQRDSLLCFTVHLYLCIFGSIR